MDSSTPKFGEWLRAPISGRINGRSQVGVYAKVRGDGDDVGGWSNLQSEEGNVQIVNLLCSDVVGVSGPQVGPTLTEPLGKGGVCQGVTDSNFRAVGSEVVSF
ncbi:hypothetical protein ACOSQ3_014496 [Xanthoceras sorbifolium]